MHDVHTCSYINDVLQIEKTFNFELPAWATSEVLKQMDDVHKIAVELWGKTRKLQRFRTGVFLNDLTKKIERAIKTPKDRGLRKLNVYSTVGL